MIDVERYTGQEMRAMHFDKPESICDVCDRPCVDHDWVELDKDGFVSNCMWKGVMYGPPSSE